ncbi:FAD-linked oxidase C-terminal domain-containing protein [soil metagenome]
MSSDSHRVLDDLRRALGDAVVTDPEVLAAARADRSGHRSAAPPLAVIEPRTVADVQAALRLASANRLPVVPRGAGTGLAGGAVGGPGELVISMRRMTRLLEVSPADELAVIEPGIVNDDLNAQLVPYGLWFAPDPASKAISTVGGNIATNAGGLLCAKYGVTREAVLALKVVLADGRLLELGHRTVKGVTGYDLTALMIGSEGTLGVIVEATVKLRPLPGGPVATIAAYFTDVVAAASSSAAITAAAVRPAAMELMDAVSVAAISDHLGLELGEPGHCALIVQTEGPSSAADAAAAMAIIAAHGGVAELSTDPEEGERLFEIRRAFHPAISALGEVLIEDVAVPRSALPAMFAAIADLEHRYGMTIPTVAHAGDGNLHPNFVYPAEPDGAVPERIWDAAGELFSEALRLGGTLTGEHGIGLLKRRWLGQELGDEQLQLQRSIKAVFDPLGIMNPGKVL